MTRKRVKKAVAFSFILLVSFGPAARVFPVRNPSFDRRVEEIV